DRAPRWAYRQCPEAAKRGTGYSTFLREPEWEVSSITEVGTFTIAAPCSASPRVFYETLGRTAYCRSCKIIQQCPRIPADPGCRPFHVLCVASTLRLNCFRRRPSTRSGIHRGCWYN